MLGIIDAVIILALLAGAVLGFKKGVIQSGVVFIGTLLIIVLAFIFKNPLSNFMYTYFPFFKFGGAFEGVTVLNILIYEGIAFIIMFGLLYAVLRALIMFTGIIEKILKYTIVLGIPSKLLGAVLGLFEAFIFIFVILFVLAQFNFSSELIRDSKYANTILNKTPVLSGVVSDTFKSVEEIYSLKDKYEKQNNKDTYNLEALEILLKYDILDAKSARNLVDRKKITTNGALSIIEKYEVKK